MIPRASSRKDTKILGQSRIHVKDVATTMTEGWFVWHHTFLLDWAHLRWRRALYDRRQSWED
jgi:uncharacterized membrane protein